MGSKQQRGVYTANNQSNSYVHENYHVFKSQYLVFSRADPSIYYVNIGSLSLVHLCRNMYITAVYPPIKRQTSYLLSV
jgi:hypothetical protein